MTNPIKLRIDEEHYVEGTVEELDECLAVVFDILPTFELVAAAADYFGTHRIDIRSGVWKCDHTILYVYDATRAMQTPPSYLDEMIASLEAMPSVVDEDVDLSEILTPEFVRALLEPE